MTARWGELGRGELPTIENALTKISNASRIVWAMSWSGVRIACQANAWSELLVSGTPARRLHGAAWADASDGMFVVAGRDESGSELSDKVERPKPMPVGPF